MKKTGLYLSFLAVPLAFSCNQTGNKSSDLKDTLSSLSPAVASEKCFVAVDERDTAKLTLHETDNGKITGHLVINYLDKGKNDGEISGAYKGDTLFVDYTFKIGTTNKVFYKNPLAFLKKEGKLVLGVGQIETSMGKSYFVKGKPISFEKGRFTFVPTDCAK
ncbi:hypothetical protein [Pedobacter nyackensis]|uniref:hypothetical protein n=1 Tax=Pedobacter nyackensis TaxID=475255 RepID=UPI00292F7A13|nr:hypothetical protein [Pedobacter nyackensis]